MTSDETGVALRILTAINNRNDPDARDVLLLCLYFPDESYLEPDELACLVIQRALDSRKTPQGEQNWGRLTKTGVMGAS